MSRASIPMALLLLVAVSSACGDGGDSVGEAPVEVPLPPTSGGQPGDNDGSGGGGGVKSPTMIPVPIPVPSSGDEGSGDTGADDSGDGADDGGADTVRVHFVAGFQSLAFDGGSANVDGQRAFQHSLTAATVGDAIKLISGYRISLQTENDDGP